ncbi:MAG: hypothetical protein JNM27_17570 [Leptospirales bacterium]|nr:hypothetical protein [Leptospirales bacterium]
MIAKILLTVCALIYGLAVPILEVNTTHVFNPHWPAHARLHEVWQLITNSGLAVYTLWLTWRKKDIRTSVAIGLFVTVGFMISFLIRDFYGGSMVHPDGSEKTLLGMNIGVLGFLIADALLLIAYFLSRKSSGPA